MSSLRSFARWRFLALVLASAAAPPFVAPLAVAPLSAQSIRTVSDAEPILVPGGDPLALRIDGTGLDGITEVRFLKDGREVRGLRGELRTTARSITVTIVADRLLDPLEGVDIELRGPRIRQPMRVPAKLQVRAEVGRRPSRTDGGKMPGPSPLPAPDPPASDPSIQVESIEIDPLGVYEGESRKGSVRLTAVSSEPVEVEIVSAQPGSAESPGVIVVPAGALEAEFELRAREPFGAMAGQFTIQARKVPFTSGPSHPVRVYPAPAPEVAVLPNTTMGDGFDLGDNSFGGPAPAFPVRSGQSRTLKIRLQAAPTLGGSIHLTATGPVSVPTGRLTLGSIGADRVLSAQVSFPSVTTPQQAVITVHGYGAQVSESVDVWPDQVFVVGIEEENCGSCTSVSIVGGDAARLEVTLSQPAQAGGYAVPVQISDVAALSPVSLTIPAGQTSGELIVGAQVTDTPRTVTLTIGDVLPQTFTIQIQPGGGA